MNLPTFVRAVCSPAIALAMLTACAVADPGSASTPPTRTVSFDHPDGPYTPEMMRADLGATAVANRDFGEIKDGALRISFFEGKKVSGTGFGAYPSIPTAQQCTLQFRIRFAEDFESRLHGKQFGLSGGRGYDGGKGQAARDNGDGWSIRLQFDSREDSITNQLYVYHAMMQGVYGDALGTNARRFALQRGTWHTLRLRVTMQSSPETADGRIELWCDDELKFDVDDVRFVTREEGRNINRIRLEMFPGGGGAMPSRDTHIDIDDLEWTWNTEPQKDQPTP